MGSKGSFRALFDMSEYREFHRVCLAYVNQMFQQISGINLITYYAPTLYGQVGLAGGHLPKLLSAWQPPWQCCLVRTGRSSTMTMRRLGIPKRLSCSSLTLSSLLVGSV